MVELALIMGSYRFTYGTFPVDNRGEEYALYRLREIMGSDELCPCCSPPFDWDHADKKVKNSRVYYVNANVDVFSVTGKGPITIIFAGSTPSDKRSYAIDSNLTTYVLILKGPANPSMAYVGQPLSNLLRDANILDTKEVPFLKDLWEKGLIGKGSH